MAGQWQGDDDGEQFGAAPVIKHARFCWGVFLGMAKRHGLLSPGFYCYCAVRVGDVLTYR